MAAKQHAPWKSCIVGYGEEHPEQLLGNPKNWRIHPGAQQKALSGILNSVGLVQNVIVNTVTGHIVDGHLRVQMAISEKQPTIPITYVTLSPEDEAVILASLDPIAALAIPDADSFSSLLEDLTITDSAVTEFLADVHADMTKGKSSKPAKPKKPCTCPTCGSVFTPE